MSSPFAMPANAMGMKSTLLKNYDIVVGVTSTLLTVATIAVALRIWVRTRMTKSFGADDIFMIAAWTAYLVTSTLSYVSTHIERVFVQTQELIVASNTLVQLIRYGNASYALTMVLVKISLGLFFLRLFATSTNYRFQRIFIWTLMGVSTAVGFVYLVMTFATCGIMVQSQKTTPMKTGSDWCSTQQAFVNVSIAWSFLNSASDVVFTGFGVFALYKAKMSQAAKISACVLLVIGSIGIVASCARIAIQLPLVDISISGILLVEWSNIEAGLCIVAGSLITLRPMLQRGLASARSTLASLTLTRSSAFSAASSSSSSESCDKSAAAASSSTKDSAGVTNDATGNQCSKCNQCAAKAADCIEKGQGKGVVVTTTYSVHSGDHDSFSEKDCRSPFGG